MASDMTQQPTQQSTQPSTQQPTPQQIEADIARQREELADTIDALQDRLDIRRRPKVIAAAAVAALAVVGVVVWRQIR